MTTPDALPDLEPLIRAIDDLLGSYERLSGRQTGPESILDGYRARVDAVRHAATPAVEAFLAEVRDEQMHQGLGLAQCHDQMNCNRPALRPLHYLEIELVKESIKPRRCKKHFRQAPKKLARGKKRNVAAPTELAAPRPIGALLATIDADQVVESSRHLVTNHGTRAASKLPRKQAKARKKILERDIRALEACLFLIYDARVAENQNVYPFSHAIATYLTMGR
jgi:hypothetical protein